MLVSKRLLLRPCQQMGCLEHILDLSAIQRHPGQGLQLFVGELFSPCSASQELLPDMATGSHVQIWVDDGDVDSRFKSWINVPSAVGSEEEDALEDNCQLIGSDLPGTHCWCRCTVGCARSYSFLWSLTDTRTRGNYQWFLFTYRQKHREGRLASWLRWLHLILYLSWDWLI